MNAWADLFQQVNDEATPGWLKSRRIAAFARFEHLGIPTPRDEDWKYTDLKRLSKRQFDMAQTEASVSHTDQAELLDLNAWRIVLVNGVFSPDLSDLSDLPNQVTIEPLSQAMTHDQELAGGLVGRLAAIDTDSLTALSNAMAQEGALIRVGSGVVLSRPIQLVYLSTEHESALASWPRIAVVAGPNSQMTIVEQLVGQHASGHYTQRVAELFLEGNAQLTHYLLQTPAEKDLWVGRVHVEQKRDSRYQAFHLNLGGALVRDDFVCELNARGATASLNGLLFGQGRQHLDMHSKVNHNAPNTYSDENYKGILNDRARGVFNGKVIVKRDSQQIEAHQNNANLLLSDQAEMDTKPELEIYADDVKCSHGTTTGQLDENAVFALRARGIDESVARGLLTLAFANQVLDQVTLDAVHDTVEARIAGALPERFNLKGLVLEDQEAQ